MQYMFNEAKSFNQDLTIWQILKDDLDESVLKYCEDLTSEHISNYLSKKELELKEQLTKTGCLGLKKDLQNTDNSSIRVRQYELLSNFKELKDKLQAKQVLEIGREKNINRPNI
jgi:hypothetical protein